MACRRPGALVNKSPSAWPGRDSKTDEHLFGTSNGMVRGRALKRRGDGGTLLSWCGNCGTRHQSHEEDRRRCAELRVKRRKHRLSRNASAWGQRRQKPTEQLESHREREQFRSPHQTRHLPSAEKLTNVEDAPIKVAPGSDATARLLTGRRVDSVHDGGEEGQMDDARL